jgi:hypothetical protein
MKLHQKLRPNLKNLFVSHCLRGVSSGKDLNIDSSGVK